MAVRAPGLLWPFVMGHETGYEWEEGSAWGVAVPFHSYNTCTYICIYIYICVYIYVYTCR